jgi:hypothetical protein
MLDEREHSDLGKLLLTLRTAQLADANPVTE